MTSPFTPAIQLQLTTAKAILRAAFPHAALISIAYENNIFASGLRDGGWIVSVGFVNRESEQVFAPELEDAVREIAMRGVPQAMATVAQLGALAPAAALGESDVHRN